MALYAGTQRYCVVIGLAREKLKAAALFVAILAVVGCVCWVVMTVSLAHVHPHVTQPEANLMVHSVCSALAGLG